LFGGAGARIDRAEFDGRIASCAVDEALTATPAPLRLHSTRSLRMKILIVDDSKPVRRMMASLVESLGHDCLYAADGLEGLVVLMQNEDVDVVLLDREMPNLDGIGFLERLGETTKSAPPVIMVSSHNDPELTLEALDAGAAAFIGKPFDAEGLKEQLAAVTRGDA